MSVPAFLGVFFAMAFLDVLFAIYIRRTSQGRAHQAALAGALTFLFSAFVVVKYIENLVYLIPAMLGSYVGTYATVKIDTLRKSKKEKILKE